MLGDSGADVVISRSDVLERLGLGGIDADTNTSTIQTQTQTHYPIPIPTDASQTPLLFPPIFYVLMMRV